MVNKRVVTISLLVAAAGAAHAQAPEAAPATMPAGDPFQKGTLGFGFPITLLTNLVAPAPGLELVPTVNVLYFLDNKAAVDLIGGFNLHKRQVSDGGTPPMTVDQTIFGFAVGAGYRMYKHMDKLHSFIEPQLILAWPDTGNSGSFALRVAGYFGAERMVTDWFSFAGAVGVGLNAANKFNDLQVASSANLLVNFYWK